MVVNKFTSTELQISGPENHKWNFFFLISKGFP